MIVDTFSVTNYSFTPNGILVPRLPRLPKLVCSHCMMQILIDLSSSVSSEMLHSECIPISGNSEEDKRSRVSLATALQPSVHSLQKLTVDMFSTR